MSHPKPLITIRDLTKYFPLSSPLFGKGKRAVHAVESVSLDIYEGETLGVVGESGCGKSTLGRVILGLIPRTAGSVIYHGTLPDGRRPAYMEKALRDKQDAPANGLDLARLTSEEMRHLRRELQIIFQDPYSSLDPRMTVGEIIAEGPLTHRFFRRRDPALRAYILSVMQSCGLEADMLHRYPHQFSGGQRQRVAIARALAVRPRFVVCDECVSALDVSIQSQIINLLGDRKAEERLTYLFISHDLSVVRHIADRIAVMYLGTVVELGTAAEVFDDPRHPYTAVLLSAIPSVERGEQRVRILPEGHIPSPADPPTGCRFHTRCPMAREICRREAPPLSEHTPGHLAACHFPGKKTAERLQKSAKCGTIEKE